MISKIPVVLEQLSEPKVDAALLRAAIIAELDAINLYEEIVATTLNEDLKKAVEHVIAEEKTHIGEFQKVLVMVDKEQDKKLQEGYNEIAKAINE